jgi:hypothetical protein
MNEETATTAPEMSDKTDIKIILQPSVTVSRLVNNDEERLV